MSERLKPGYRTSRETWREYARLHVVPEENVDRFADRLASNAAASDPWRLFNGGLAAAAVWDETADALKECGAPAATVVGFRRTARAARKRLARSQRHRRMQPPRSRPQRPQRRPLGRSRRVSRRVRTGHRGPPREADDDDLASPEAS